MPRLNQRRRRNCKKEKLQGKGHEKTRPHTTTVGSLPGEIIVHIFSFVDCITRRTTLTAICRRWLAIVTDPRQKHRGCMDRLDRLSLDSVVGAVLQHDHAICMETALPVWTRPSIAQTARHGAAQCFVRLREMGVAIRLDDICKMAAWGRVSMLGHIETVGINKHYRSDLCKRAAKRGHIQTIDWLRQRGCPWDETVCAKAARHGQLATLRWLHEGGCPWDDATTREASSAGWVDCLIYAHENGCPINQVSVNCAWKQSHHHRHVREYLLKHDFIPSPEVLELFVVTQRPSLDRKRVSYRARAVVGGPDPDDLVLPSALCLVVVRPHFQ
jgi:hypothetical protein